MEQAQRPYIICHMTTSLDGKVTGEHLRRDHHGPSAKYITKSTAITKQMPMPVVGLPWRAALPAGGIPI